MIGSKFLHSTREHNEHTASKVAKCLKKYWKLGGKRKIFADGSCLLCLEQFNDSDIVAQLKCDSWHIYHYECLEKYVAEAEEFKCPLCKAKIVFYT